ncbi:MAG: GNAT family N-acetyltransferase [Akkermansiaceae bacterium]
MNIEITSEAKREDEAAIIDGTRAHNRHHMPPDVEALCVFDRLDNGDIVAGLTGKTYWNYLDIGYLWVAEAYRGQGRATAIIQLAEAEALRRGCNNVLLDTYSFQALGFYENLGYREFGGIDDFSGGQTRHYLRKKLSGSDSMKARGAQ